jgi:membrane protein implicated in regulation of membrane protease activity
MYFILAWLIAGLIFLMIEMLSPGLFFFLSFFFGSLGAAVAAALPVPVTQQVLIFFATAIAAFIVLRYWIKQKHVHSHYQSNVYALIGKRGRAITNITPASVGQVNVQGEIWSAKLSDDGVIQKGAVVEVVSVIGCHVVVKQYSLAKEQQ